MQTSGQSMPLVQALKRQLRQQGKTYAQVAVHLNLSEASVKRLFASGDMSLKRLDAICTMLDLQFADLVAQMQKYQYEQVSELSHSQEREIADDLGLLLVTVLVLNRWSFADILQRYRFSDSRLTRYLARLDRIRLIELQPGNRIKLLVAPNFKWRDRGPIHTLFLERIEAEFFKSDFSAAGEQLLVLNGMLSERSNQHFQRRMLKLAAEFDELSRDESSLPLVQRHGSSVLLAIRNWDYSELFGHLRSNL